MQFFFLLVRICNNYVTICLLIVALETDTRCFYPQTVLNGKEKGTRDSPVSNLSRELTFTSGVVPKRAAGSILGLGEEGA